jgi:hypothetical protein
VLPGTDEEALSRLQMVDIQPVPIVAGFKPALARKYVMEKKMISGRRPKGMQRITFFITELIEGKVYKILVGEYPVKRFFQKRFLPPYGLFIAVLPRED